MFKLKTFVLCAALTALALTAQAQSAKPAKKAAPAKKGPGVLYPQFTPTKGTWEQPADKIGSAPSSPWSATTVGAAVDGKPVAGEITTLIGEIIDYSCYLQVGKHGDKHRDCGQKCFRHGQPIGLMTKDGSIYLLMEEEHNPRRDGLTALREKAIEHVGNIVEVTGTSSKVDGQKALYVTGLIK
ncbi:MAG: hypothetical protein HOP19_20300 [Acidobacteria bacterium]|nr:hypothetical protein [Acidobacteriota bacterium]